MRRAVYQVLLKAPFKIGAALSGGAGFVGSVWPDKVKAVLDSGSFPVQTVSAVLLGLAVLYFALLWWLKPGERDEGGGITQTTHGPNSPNYGTVRDVHNYFGPPAPAATQPAKSPYGSARSRVLDDDDLGRLLRRPTVGERLLRRAHEQRDRCPKMPIHIALHQIAARIGDTDKLHGFPKARQEFRQAAHEGQIDVWGQRQIPPTHLQDNRHKGVWSRIDPEHWEDHALHPRAVLKDQQDQPHTEEEEIGRISNRYWSLKVHPEDIDHRWQKPLRTTYDGKP